MLFLDAVKLQIGELGKGWLVSALILGPGTGIIIGLGAVAFAFLLGFPWLMAFIGGAVLASTDPVVLREVVRDRRIPSSVRQVLKFEAETNDIIVLPVILILVSVANACAGSPSQWVVFILKLRTTGHILL